MYGASRYFLWIIALMLAPVIVHAQGPILVSLTQPPPNQLKVSDLWKVDITNTSNQEVTVFLRGYADETVEGRIVDAHSRAFSIAAGQRMRVTGPMLEPIEVDEWNERFKVAILRTGLLPTGEYRVCVEVIQTSDLAIIGTDCFDHHDIEQLTPPMLVFPLDESTVTEKLPTFNWLPPTPMRRGEGMSYQLRIVEMLGRQTPYDAMTSNPAYFDMRDIAANQFRFPLGARGFQVGSTYAWQIRAFLVQRFGDRIPMGESEIWWFTYGTIMNIGDDLDDDEIKNLKDINPNWNAPPDGDKPLIGGDQPKIGRTNVTVIKDNSLKAGFMPPNTDLTSIWKVKPEIILSPTMLRALMHTCQGAD